MSSRELKGLSLLEVIVVIAIIGILSLLLLPVVQASREMGRRTACSNNLRQISLAILCYHDAHKSFPAGFVSEENSGIRFIDELNPNGWGWFSTTLPYLEKNNLADKLKFSEPMYSSSNIPCCNVTYPEFFCPSDSATVSRTFSIQQLDGTPKWPGDRMSAYWETSLGATNYVACSGFAKVVKEYPPRFIHFSTVVPQNKKGIFYHNSSTRLDDIRDGTSNTIMVGERSSRIMNSSWAGALSTTPHHFWLTLATSECPPNHKDNLMSKFEVEIERGFSSNHPGICMINFVDGSVSPVSELVDSAVFSSLGTYSGRELVSDSSWR